MEQIGKQIGKAVLYTISSILMMVIVLSVYKNGGVMNEAVKVYMNGICGG